MATNQNSSTITGDVKSRIDKIWDTLWAGGITVPVTILEQLTYLFFIKLLDDKQRHEESNAIEFGYELENPLFKKGEKWLNPETNQEIAYEDLRWSVFKGFSAQNMLHHVRNNVFVFIKALVRRVVLPTAVICRMPCSASLRLMCCSR
jgi:type I restriction enzyme M protein